MLVVLFFYMVMTLTGYFATLDDTPEVVLTRPLPPGWRFDIAQILSCFCIMIVMLANCVVSYQPFRNSFYFMWKGEVDVPTRPNVIITACFCIGTGIISIVFPKVTKVLGIFGGFASVNICYLVPIICYIRLRKEGESLWLPKNLFAILYFCFLCVMGWLSVITTVMSIFWPELIRP